MANLPNANPRGQKPPPNTLTKQQPFSAAVGLAKEAENFGYTGVDKGNSGDGAVSGIHPVTKQRETFINGRSSLALAAEKAAASGAPYNPGKGGSAPFLNPIQDSAGKTIGGIDPQTGQNVTLQNGRFVGDGKPNIDLVNKLKATPPPAAAPATPTHSADDEQWKQTFGKYPGTAAAPDKSLAPSIPANIGPAQNTMDAQSAVAHDAQYGNQPVAAPAAPAPVPARNPAGYITDAGAQDAANQASRAQYPQPPTYGKVGPAVPVTVGTPVSQTTDAQGNTVIQHAGGGTAVLPQAQPQAAPASGGSGIFRNGVEQVKDAQGNFVNKAPVIPPGLGDLRQADEARVNQMQTDANNATARTAPGLGDLRQADEQRVTNENAVRADQASLASQVSGAPQVNPSYPKVYQPGQNYSADLNVNQGMRDMQNTYNGLDPSLTTAAPNLPAYSAPKLPAPVAAQPTITAPAAAVPAPAPPKIPAIVPPVANIAQAPEPATPLAPVSYPQPPKDDEDEKMRRLSYMQ